MCGVPCLISRVNIGCIVMCVCSIQALIYAPHAGGFQWAKVRVFNDVHGFHFLLHELGEPLPKSGAQLVRSLGCKPFDKKACVALPEARIDCFDAFIAFMDIHATWRGGCVCITVL